MGLYIHSDIRTVHARFAYSLPGFLSFSACCCPPFISMISSLSLSAAPALARAQMHICIAARWSRVWYSPKQNSRQFEKSLQRTRLIDEIFMSAAAHRDSSALIRDFVCTHCIAAVLVLLLPSLRCPRLPAFSFSPSPTRAMLREPCKLMLAKYFQRLAAFIGMPAIFTRF